MQIQARADHIGRTSHDSLGARGTRARTKCPRCGCARGSSPGSPAHASPSALEARRRPRRALASAGSHLLPRAVLIDEAFARNAAALVRESRGEHSSNVRERADCAAHATQSSPIASRDGRHASVRTRTRVRHDGNVEACALCMLVVHARNTSSNDRCLLSPSTSLMSYQSLHRATTSHIMPARARARARPRPRWHSLVRVGAERELGQRGAIGTRGAPSRGLAQPVHVREAT